MKKLFTLIILAGASLANAQSPISISNSNMPSSGDTLRYSNAQISSLGNYTATGTNFTWNFSTLVPTSQGIRNFKAALQTPYAFFFFGLNEYGEKIADTLGAGPAVMTNYYNYYKKQGSPAAFIADGVGITFSSVPVPSYYSDKDELYMFPMSYPKYDSTTFKFSTASNTMIPIKYSKTGYRVTVVDGWGSITTPFGTANCLRLITTQYSQDSIKNTIIPAFSVGFPNYQRSYQWMTTTTKIPYLEITGNLSGNNFTPTQARYRDSARDLTAGLRENYGPEDILLFPNPVQDELCMNLRQENTKLEIFNIQGQLLRSLKFDGPQEKVKLDVSGLGTGVYVMKMSEGANSYYFKFIKD